MIVVAIVAILAVIALPNLLQAQVRAKVARARGDLRTFATGIEAYLVDTGAYPPSESFLATVDLRRLSTPVAYSTDAAARDPFGTPAINLPGGPAPNAPRGYAYTAYNAGSRFFEFEPPACSAVPFTGWGVMSQGPNQKLDGAASLVFRSCPLAPAVFMDDLAGRIYDPTNGTISRGDLIRFGGATPAIVLQGTP